MAPRGDKKAGESVVSAAPPGPGRGPTVPIEDTVIQVDDKLYSAQKLAEVHPGGNLCLLLHLSSHVVCVSACIVFSMVCFNDTLVTFCLHRRTIRARVCRQGCHGRLHLVPPQELPAPPGEGRARGQQGGHPVRDLRQGLPRAVRHHRQGAPAPQVLRPAVVLCEDCASAGHSSCP